MAGLILCDAKVKYGRESAAASVFDVEEEEAAEDWFVVVGDRGVFELPTAPDVDGEDACLGACWRRN